MKKIILRTLLVFSALLFIIIYSCTDSTPTTPVTNSHPYGDGKGRFTFYKTMSVSGGVTITIDTVQLHDNVHWDTNPPDCDNSNATHIDLAAGTYEVTFSGQGVNCAPYSATIESDKCKKLDYSGCMGTGNNCNWNSAVNCITVVSALVGTRCGNPQSLEVVIRNSCSSPIKTYFYTQQTNGTWFGTTDGTFLDGVQPGATVTWYNCSSVGTYYLYAMPIDMYVNNHCTWPPHP